MTKKCLKCQWLEKYGIDFLKNYGEVNINTLSQFLNIDLERLKYNENYKIFMEKLKDESLQK